MKTPSRRTKVLIIDDEIGIRDLLSEVLIDENYAVVTAYDAASAHEMRVQETPDIILLDIWMPDMDGVSLLRKWAESGFPSVPVIVMSGHATIDIAVEAMRLGALEVLEKPITTPQLLGAMQKARIQKGKQDSNLMLQQIDFGSSAAMQEFKKNLLTVAAEPGLITLVGALNCGATFYAQFLARPQRPVVVIDNSSVLEGNIGGIVRQAEDGVVIVQLVNVLNPIQQNGMLGLIREINKGEARIVAVSTERPDALENASDYNKTLISLLSRRVVSVPSLSKCSGDLPTIIELICRHLTKDNDMKGRTLSPEAIEALVAHTYAEDFSELMSLIRSIFLYSQSKRVEAGTVKSVIKQAATHFSARSMFDEMYNMSLREARDYFEREYFTRLISMTNGNMQQAAKIAGLERTYFYRKLKQYKADGKNPNVE